MRPALCFAKPRAIVTRISTNPPYSKGVLQPLAETYLARSLPLEFIDSGDLAGDDLARFKLLVLPETSGLTGQEVERLKRDVRRGGQLLLSGKMLCYDERGLPLGDFCLAKEMGLSLSTRPLSKRHEKTYGNGKIVYLASPYGAGPTGREIRPPSCRFSPNTATPCQRQTR